MDIHVDGVKYNETYKYREML